MKYTLPPSQPQWTTTPRAYSDQAINELRAEVVGAARALRDVLLERADRLGLLDGSNDEPNGAMAASSALGEALERLDAALGLPPTMSEQLQLEAERPSATPADARKEDEHG